MKRILTLILTFVFLAAAGTSTAAATINVSGELANLKTYYANRYPKEKELLSVWEESLAFASMNMLTSRFAPYLPEDDGGATPKAKRLLTSVAQKNPAEERTEELNALIAMQDKNGSFGTAEDTVFAMLAIKACKGSFNSVKAYRELLNTQKENGSFADDVRLTALAISLLAQTDNQSEKDALEAAALYLNTFEAKDETELCWQIIGLCDAGLASSDKTSELLTQLLTYQNHNDYSYTSVYERTEGEPYATVMALTAFDAVNRSGSLYLRISRDGNLSLYETRDFLPLLITFIVLLFLSVLFWIFILLHKKNTKTLEETKKY